MYGSFSLWDQCGHIDEPQHTEFWLTCRITPDLMNHDDDNELPDLNGDSQVKLLKVQNF